MLKKQHLTPHDRLSRAKERLGKSKGSVLFFVLAIMSVMIVMAAAVYYAVSSARQEVEAKYASEQAYQSAISINDMVSDYIAADPNNKFISAALGLADGDSIKTNITDLPAGTGNVSVTITKISGTADSAILSITTESVVNGETQVVTSVGELKEGEEEGEAASLSRFFTSTGYVPNDTLFQGKVDSELFFDCEYTEVGGGGDQVYIKADIITSGSLKLNGGVKIDNPPTAVNLTVGNDLYLTEPSSENLNFNGGTVRIGGSVIQTENAHNFANATVYIQGDYYAGAQGNSNNKYYINGNLVLFGNGVLNGDVYVNGDVYIDRSYNKNSVQEIANKLTIGGNLYYDNNKTSFGADTKADVKGKKIQADVNFNIGSSTMIYNTEEAIENVIAATAAESGGVHGYSDIWPSKAVAENPCESMATVTQNIKDTLGNNKYIDWQLDKLFHVGENVNNPYIDVTPIEFGQNDRTFTLSAKDNDKFIIQDIDVKQGEGSALIIDTADGAGGFKDVYIMLKPNCYYNEDTGELLLGKSGSLTYTVNHYHYKCLACGTEFDSDELPENAVCPSCAVTSLFTKHYHCNDCGNDGTYTGNDWEFYECESCGKTWGSMTKTYYCNACGNSSDPNSVQNNRCPICSNTSVFSELSRTQENKTKDWTEDDANAFKFCDTVPNDGQSTPNNTNFFHVMVKGQGSVILFIPNSETFIATEEGYIGHYALYKELNNGSEELKMAQNFTSNLQTLVDSAKFDANKGLYVEEGVSDENNLIKKYSDEGLYIHNNIFLASSEKNININFATDHSLFAGLIYAPYMQFNERGGSSASNKAYFGGLVVSNFNLDASQPKTFYCAVYDYYDRFTKDKNDDGSPLTPEQKEEERGKYLEHLMGQTGSNQLLGGAGGGQLGRAWKKFGYN